jgi:pimeloyl-ACP methyl ester carboxylesterase
VVICNPFGQEYIRAHRPLRELASRLAEAGFHTLRFDYHGCGDSAGEAGEARLEEWLADTAAAVAEVRELTGSPQVALVGLRLGGAIAVLAASRQGGAEALVLWDPVIDGAGYLRELRVSHEAWMRAHARGAVAGREEVLGFPLSAALTADLEGLAIPSLAVPSRRALVVSSDGGTGAPPMWDGVSGDVVARRRFSPAPVWLHAEGEERALVPGELLDHVAAWMGGVCP